MMKKKLFKNLKKTHRLKRSQKKGSKWTKHPISLKKLLHKQRKRRKKLKNQREKVRARQRVKVLAKRKGRMEKNLKLLGYLEVPRRPRKTMMKTLSTPQRMTSTPRKMKSVKVTNPKVATMIVRVVVKVTVEVKAFTIKQIIGCQNHIIKTIRSVSRQKTSVLRS